jgi:putative ATP-dependent endonuclease of OLD family
MGYRMSILPAEAFFSNGVFLVEGPSEMLFYTELADSLDIDLDFLNISLLSVDGISFGVYTKILDALEIHWVMRTDNDISKVSKKE